MPETANQPDEPGPDLPAFFYMHKTAIALSGGADSLMSLHSAPGNRGRRVMGVHARFLSDVTTKPCDERAARSVRHPCRALRHLVDLRREFEELVIAPFVTRLSVRTDPQPLRDLQSGHKIRPAAGQGAGTGRGSAGHRPLCPPAAGAAAGSGPVQGTRCGQGSELFPVQGARGKRFELCPLPTVAAWTKNAVRLALAEQRAWSSSSRAAKARRCVSFPPITGTFLRRKKSRDGRADPDPSALADGTVLGRHARPLEPYPRTAQGPWHRLDSEPLYVTGKDFAHNRLLVGPKAEDSCRPGLPHGTSANLLLSARGLWPHEVLVQTIYRQRPEPALR